jgi:hypothetical protein
MDQTSRHRPTVAAPNVSDKRQRSTASPFRLAGDQIDVRVPVEASSTMTGP